MKRLVYSPSINVWVKSDFGVVDLSPYVTECTVARRVNEVSQAQVSFRNPKNFDGRFIFTEYKSSNGSIGPVFHPMDPIIITFTRIKGHPIQVFTGYLDTSPYVQLFPGTATLTASCTLKRLLHTYWDPGLAFVAEFMKQYGWTYDPISGTSILNNSQSDNTPQLNDTGIGVLLAAMLNEVGGWEKNDILIQPLPSQSIQKQVGKIFDQLVQSGKDGISQYVDYMNEYVNAAASVGGPTVDSTANTNSSTGSIIPPYNGKQGKLTPLEAKSAAKNMLSSFGWGEDQWPSLETLWEHESNWRWDAGNPSSGAYGIPQALPANKMANTSNGGGSDYATNAVTQIRWGLNYIKNRYGSPKAAWTFWQNPTNSPSGASRNWY